MSSALFKFRFSFVFVFLILPIISLGCTFPAGLTGDFDTSSRGTLTFTSTTFSPWSVSGVGTFTFTCLQNNGSIYISQSSTSFNYLGNTWYAYLCMDLNTINTDVYTYNLGTSLLNNEKVKVVLENTPITQDLICDNTNFDIGTYDVMVKSGSAPSAASNCPSMLQANWMYSFDTGSGDRCSSGSSLDVCSTTSMLAFNYTVCSEPIAYSSNGSLYCIHSSTSGSTTYLTLYNDDSSTDETTNYRFSCLVITNDGSTVYMTQSPKTCLANQNSTTIESPGAAIVLTSKATSTTTTTTTTTTIATTLAAVVEEQVSSAVAVGLGVTFALLAVLVLAAFLIWYIWTQKKNKEKTRGNKDVEDGGKDVAKGDGDGDQVEHTPVSVIGNGGTGLPPDVLPRHTPTGSLQENGRPTTSGSIHVVLPSENDSERDDRSIDMLSEEIEANHTSYAVMGVHPVHEESDSTDGSMRTYPAQKGIVPKGAVALGNGLKSRPKPVARKGKLPPMEGKPLPPIVEDTTPRGFNTPMKKRFGSKGIQETTTESGSDDLPGQVERSNSNRGSGGRGQVKLRAIRQLKSVKKPVGQDKPDRRVRTRSFKDKNSVTEDEESPAPTPVRVTRVDLAAMNTAKEDPPKKSPRNKRSDLKVVDYEDESEKRVSSSESRGYSKPKRRYSTSRGISPEPSYTPSSRYLRGFSDDVTTVAHEAPVARAPSPRGPMLRDRPNSSRTPRSFEDDHKAWARKNRSKSAVSRSATFADDRYRNRYVERNYSPLPSDYRDTRHSMPEFDDRPRSRSKSRGRKRVKDLARSRSEVRPMSAPGFVTKSLTLDVEEVPNEDGGPDKVLAARSLAFDMEQVPDPEALEEKVGTRRGCDVRPKQKGKQRAKTAVARSTAADEERSLRFWVFFARPIILLTRKFQPSSYMRRGDAIADDKVEDWSMRSPRSPRRSSNLSSIHRRHARPVKIEFGTTSATKIRELD